MTLKTIKNRTALFILPAGGIAVVAFVLSWLGTMGTASAQAAATSPIVVANAATGDAWDLVAKYGPIWGVALLVVGIVGALLKANGSSHWIAQGRVLAALTGLASVGAALLEWKFNGAPIAGVLVTAVMAIKLVISPTIAPAKSGGPGVVNITNVAALCLVVAAAVAGCASGSPARVGAADAVSKELACTGPAIAETVNDLGDAAMTFVHSKISGDGQKIDSTAIKSDLKAVASMAWDCAVSTAFAVLLNGGVSIAHVAGPSQSPSRAALQAAWSDVKTGLGVSSVATSVGRI
jgi:hypothetical protein